MSDITPDQIAQLDLREKIAHIDLMLAQIEQAQADASRKRQERYWAPWQIATALITASAALLTTGALAGTGLIKLFGG